MVFSYEKEVIIKYLQIKYKYGFWNLVAPGANVYHGRRITYLNFLKEAIIEEWNKIPQEIIDKCIDTFKLRH